MSRLLILLVVTVHYAATIEENFNLQQINNDGIFFEKISELNLYSRKLQIVTKITIPKTETITDSLAECYGYLKTLCEELTIKNKNDLCNPFLKELKWQITQIRRQTQKLNEMYGRKKRGLVDAGGKLSKFIFGTMDADDAAEIHTSLNNLQNNQVKLLELQNQQIAVIRSNYETVTKPIAELQNETEEIEKKLNLLIQRTNDQGEFIARAQGLEHQVAELSSLIIIQCMHVNQMQEEADEIITSLNIRKLHPLIVSQKTITEIVLKNNEDSHKKILRHDIQRQIIETDFMESNGQIVIKVTIPTIDEEEFALFKPYVIPRSTEEGYSIYKINTEYIAINNEKTKTIELHTEEIEKCKQIQDNLDKAFILCQHTQPILSTRTQHCITTLFLNPTIENNNCESIPTIPANTIIKLKNSNSWLFLLSEKTKLTITCDGETKNIQITNEGILTFFKPCTVTTKDFTVMVSGYQKKLEIEQQQIAVQSSEEETQLKPMDKKQVEFKKLQLIDHKEHNRNFIDESNKINNLKKISESINLQNEQRDSKIKIAGVSVTTIIIIVAIVNIILMYKRAATRATKITVNNQQPPGNKTREVGSRETELRVL